MAHLPVLHDVERRGSVFLEPHAASFGDIFLGDVVGGRAESTAGDDDIGAGKREFERGEDVRAAVGDLDGGNRDDAECEQADADGGKIGVDDGAFQQFVADADDGDLFAHK